MQLILNFQVTEIFADICIYGEILEGSSQRLIDGEIYIEPKIREPLYFMQSK